MVWGALCGEDIMWRKLNEEEKHNLLVNYKFGAYIVRFLMGAWILFVTISYFMGICTAVETITRGDYFSGIGSIVAGVIGAVFFYGIPIFLICKVGTEEIKVLKNDAIYIGEALFISGSYSHRSKQAGRAVRYLARVKLIDEHGNAYKQVECRSIGNLRNSCKEGDRITILRLVKPAGDEMVAMKKKLI